MMGIDRAGKPRSMHPTRRANVPSDREGLSKTSCLHYQFSTSAFCAPRKHSLLCAITILATSCEYSNSCTAIRAVLYEKLTSTTLNVTLVDAHRSTIIIRSFGSPHDATQQYDCCVQLLQDSHLQSATRHCLRMCQFRAGMC